MRGIGEFLTVALMAAAPMMGLASPVEPTSTSNVYPSRTPASTGELKRLFGKHHEAATMSKAIPSYTGDDNSELEIRPIRPTRAAALHAMRPSSTSTVLATATATATSYAAKASNAPWIESMMSSVTPSPVATTDVVSARGGVTSSIGPEGTKVVKAEEKEWEVKVSQTPEVNVPCEACGDDCHCDKEKKKGEVTTEKVTEKKEVVKESGAGSIVGSVSMAAIVAMTVGLMVS